MTDKPLAEHADLPWNDEERAMYFSDEGTSDPARFAQQWAKGLHDSVKHLRPSGYFSMEHARLLARLAADPDGEDSDTSMDDLDGDRCHVEDLLRLFTGFSEEQVGDCINAADRAACAGFTYDPDFGT